MAASSIPMDALKKAIDSTPRRIALCIENGGGVFKNQMKRPDAPQAAHYLDVSIYKVFLSGCPGILLIPGSMPPKYTAAGFYAI